MSADPIAMARTGLLIVDLQNDFLHPNGAYARGGQGAVSIAALPARLRPLADVFRRNARLGCLRHNPVRAHCMRQIPPLFPGEKLI